MIRYLQSLGLRHLHSPCQSANHCPKDNDGCLCRAPRTPILLQSASASPPTSHKYLPVCTSPAHGRQTNNATATASTSAPPTIDAASFDVLFWLTDSLASEFAVSAPLCPHEATGGGEFTRIVGTC